MREAIALTRAHFDLRLEHGEPLRAGAFDRSRLRLVAVAVLFVRGEPHRDRRDLEPAIGARPEDARGVDDVAVRAREARPCADEKREQEAHH